MIGNRKLQSVLSGESKESPNKWSIVPLGQIAEVRGRIGWRGLTTVDYRENGPMFIAVNNITRDFRLNLSGVARISEERYNESPEIIG